MKARLFTVFALVVSVAALVLSPALGKAEGLALVPGGTRPLLAPIPDHARVSAALRSAPLMFVEDVGQFPAPAGGAGDKRARFQVRGDNATLWLTEDGLWVTVMEQHKGVNLKLSFVGANPHPRLEPFNRLDTHVSYFIGSNPANWHADVPVWNGVRCVDFYPGLDLEVTGDGGRWGWRLTCRSNCQFDPQKVALRVDGADALALEGDTLRLITPLGEYALPLLQVIGAADANLARPTLTGDQVASPFASTIPSPQSEIRNLQSSDLLYSTFLGGSDDDAGGDIALDGAGNTYVTGYTHSFDLPTTPGAFDASLGGRSDAFVVKLNADGMRLAYATFVGGSEGDQGGAIAVDGAGSAYVTGWTRSSDFPTTAGAFDTSRDGTEDAFVVKVSADGTGLAYATFLGGSSDDRGYAIAVDGAGSAYVTGDTISSDFVTTAGAFDTNHNGHSDAYMVKLNAGGTGLVYATFLGGSGYDVGHAIALDGAGSAYATGVTQSPDFPTTAGAFDTSHSRWDAFVVKLNADGTDLAYATFVGGSGWDVGFGIAVDEAGSAYVTGYADSSDFPTTPEAFDTSHNGYRDAYAVKLNANGTGLAYATFVGGSGGDEGYAIAVDGAGSAYVAGLTGSSGFPTTAGAFDTSHNGNEDAFVVKVNADGTELAYATFLGGSNGDIGFALALDGAGSTYVAGRTNSSDLPTTPGAFDTSHGGGECAGYPCYDAFVAKIRIGEVTPTPTEITNPSFEEGFFGPVGKSVANGWAAYVIGGQPTFDGERSTVHGGSWAQKISGHAPFAAGVAQAVTVKPGATYRVTVYYQLYPPGDGQALLGVQDGTAPAQWAGGGEGGVWRLLSQTLTVDSNRLTLYLHGNNGVGLNTNVYFDDVTVTELGPP